LDRQGFIPVIAPVGAGEDGQAFNINADLVAGGSVIGSSGTDTLVAKGATLDLSNTSLTSIEKLAGSQAATTFTVDQGDLVAGGSITGSTGVDTVAAGGAALDLTSTTLTSIEKLQGATVGTTFTVDAADLVSGGSVVGASSTTTDTLIIKGTSFDVTSTSLTNIEILKAGSSLATTFTVDQADLATGGSIVGSSGTDTLTSKGTALSLANTTLTSVETLRAGSSLATTFTLDGDDLTKLTTVSGSTGIDTLVASSTGIDMTSTTLNSIEVLKAGLSLATAFTVTQVDLANGGSVVGSSGSDTLVIGGTSLDLTSTTLTSIENLKAGSSLATTFTVDAADIITGGTVQGSTGSDTLIIKGTAFDLNSTTATSIEKLQAGSSLATTFTLDTSDLANGGSIIGSSGSDILTTKSNELDLTSTTLTSVEMLKAGSATATKFTIDADDFSKLTAIIGSTGSDTLAINGTSYNLSSTAL
ncbi:MAG: hypothetical protein J0626_09435, partial [Rhodospirillaceae bacterium]|nr:hypothetical protein [Rhodospirillaceae bacterium]